MAAAVVLWPVAASAQPTEPSSETPEEALGVSPDPPAATAVEPAVDAAALAQAQAALAQARAEAQAARAELRRAQAQLEETEQRLAEHDEQQQGAYAHEGLFFRMRFGAGAGSLWSQGEAYQWPDRWSVAPGGYQSISLGGVVVDGLLLHGDVHGFVDVGRADEEDPLRLTGLVGLGATYYFMPDNLYLSGSVGPAMAMLSYARERYVDVDRDRFAGVGATLGVGKEWWVHEEWAVGLAAGLFYTYTAQWTDRGNAQKLHSTATTLSLSATYN